MHCKRTIAMSNEIEMVCIMQSQQTTRKCTLHRAQHYIRYTDNTEQRCLRTIVLCPLALYFRMCIYYNIHATLIRLAHHFNQHIIFHVI